jgi:heme-degrading monooxygenase HmoA
MIARVWHGWTTTGNADAYERLLREVVFPRIAAKGVPGYKGINLLRRRVPGSEEFVMIMWFDSLEAVKRFVGDDYEVAYVPPEARAILARFDERSQHFEVREGITC